MTALADGTSTGLVNGATTKMAKMSKNQMRRAKKKENKAKERESREGSVITVSEHERPEEADVSASSEPSFL